MDFLQGDPGGLVSYGENVGLDIPVSQSDTGDEQGVFNALFAHGTIAVHFECRSFVALFGLGLQSEGEKQEGKQCQVFHITEFNIEKNNVPLILVR
jgi:hypothetical protein